jgi:hypothetical protein
MPIWHQISFVFGFAALCALTAGLLHTAPRTLQLVVAACFYTGVTFGLLLSTFGVTLIFLRSWSTLSGTLPLPWATLLWLFPVAGLAGTLYGGREAWVRIRELWKHFREHAS